MTSLFVILLKAYVIEFFLSKMFCNDAMTSSTWYKKYNNDGISFCEKNTIKLKITFTIQCKLSLSKHNKVQFSYYVSGVAGEEGKWGHALWGRPWGRVKNVFLSKNLNLKWVFLWKKSEDRHSVSSPLNPHWPPCCWCSFVTFVTSVQLFCYLKKKQK